MKEYQKKQTSVKGSIEVLDTESLMVLASERLLALSLQVGLEVFRQLLETDVEALAEPREYTTRIGAHTGTERNRRGSSWADKR